MLLVAATAAMCVSCTVDHETRVVSSEAGVLCSQDQSGKPTCMGSGAGPVECRKQGAALCQA